MFSSFEISDEKLIYPSLKMITTEIPEEDYFEAENSDQNFIIEFANGNRFMSLTIVLNLLSSKVLSTLELPITA